jgi:regulator of protease activity HflC (stomatin/prohibitin superfamily)
VETKHEKKGPALDRRGEGASAALVLVAAGLGAGLHVASRFLDSRCAAGIAWHLLMAALPGAWAYLQFRVYRTAWELKRQEDALKARVGAESLFARLGGADPDGRRRRAEDALSVTGEAVSLALASLLALHFFSAAPPAVRNPAAGSAILALIAFAAYVGGKYVGALGALPAWRPVRPCGAWLTAGGVFAFAAGVVFAVAHAGWPVPAGLLDRVVPFWFLALALDRAAALLGRAYGLVPRDAAPGQSRLVDLVGSPARVGRSLGDAVAYHFGVRVSGRSLRAFARRVAAPFAAASALVFLLLSCFAWIETGQVGLVERFGARRAVRLGPGLHLKAPWPVDRVQILPVGRVRMAGVGPHHAGRRAGEHHEDGAGAILWSESHGDPVLFVTPAWGEEQEATGLIAISASVRFTIGDPGVYAYRARDPGRIMRLLLERELAHLTAGTDPRRFFGPDRAELAGGVTRRLSRRAAAYGIRVRDVSLEHVHMPVEVAPAFEEVARARAVKAALVAGGEADAIRKQEVLAYEARAVEERARAQRAAILARGDRRRRLVKALSPWWETLGGFLCSRLRMDVWREAAAKAPKLIVPEGAEGVRNVFQVVESGSIPFGPAGTGGK